MVSEAYFGGPAELTIRQAGGPGFFHVSTVDEKVTLGCSVTDSAMPCLYAVRDAAATDRRLRDNLTFNVQLTLQERSPAGQQRIQQLPAAGTGIGPWMERAIYDRPGLVVAARMDVGAWSWQWDDLTAIGRPEGRAFGGLTNLANFSALANVITRVGDDWVLRDFEDLLGQARAFLRHQQRY